MFLVERLPSAPGLRADLAPRQLLGTTGELVRAALAARPRTVDAEPSARRRASQLDLALPPPDRRKAG